MPVLTLYIPAEDVAFTTPNKAHHPGDDQSKGQRPPDDQREKIGVNTPNRGRWRADWKARAGCVMERPMNMHEVDINKLGKHGELVHSRG